MTTYVLVHGMWVGGWSWREVADRLRSAGHEVHAVTLTGLGERAHLADAVEVGLRTHVADVVGLIEHEDLRDVVLVGHSYAGTVLPGVADRVPERIAVQVYLDTAPAREGEWHLAIHPQEAQEAVAGFVKEQGDGRYVPAPDFAEMLPEALAAEVQGRVHPHPYATVTEPLALTGGDASGHRRVAIACDDFRGLAEAGTPRFTAVGGEGWEIHHLRTGHWPMFTAPGELSDVLSQLQLP